MKGVALVPLSSDERCLSRLSPTVLIAAMLAIATLLAMSGLFPTTTRTPWRPPVGAVYARTLRFPVIGKQTIELAILSDKVARLIMSGRLNLDEPVSYHFEASSGEMSFELTDATRRLLRRFRTTLDAAGYDGSTDTSWVVVWPPLPLSMRINLNRNLRAAAGSRQKIGSALQQRWAGVLAATKGDEELTPRSGWTFRSLWRRPADPQALA